MRNTQNIIHIGILAYQRSQSAAVYGLADLLNVANIFQEERKAESKAFDVSIIRSLDHASKNSYTVITLPPSLGERLPQAEMAPIAKWIEKSHQKGSLICSVCSGAFLLAESGLLDHRHATTHWALAEEFTCRYPKVNLNTDKLIIDDNDIIMAGGLMAWVDLGLRLIERFIGLSVMLQTARYFLVDPVGREQRFYTSFTPPLSHGDGAVLKTQHWLQLHYSAAITVPMMAEIAKLEGRTFIRRFKKATRLTPSEYLQHLRVDQAKEHLELTNLNVDEIAWQCGYEDVSAFRKVFLKIIGLTPREYRKRFQVEE